MSHPEQRQDTQFTGLFAAGADGDRLLTQRMLEVRQEQRQLLRKTLSCLDTRAEGASQLDQVVSVPAFRSDDFSLQQCKVRHIVIENVRNRL